MISKLPRNILQAFPRPSAWHRAGTTFFPLPPSYLAAEAESRRAMLPRLTATSSLPLQCHGVEKHKKSFLTWKLTISDYRSKHCYNPFFPQEKYLKILITPYARSNTNPKCRRGRKTSDCWQSCTGEYLRGTNLWPSIFYFLASPPAILFSKIIQVTKSFPTKTRSRQV